MQYQKVTPFVLIKRPQGVPAQEGTNAAHGRRAVAAREAIPARPYMVVALVDKGTENTIKPVENNQEDYDQARDQDAIRKARDQAQGLADALVNQARTGEFSSSVMEDAAQALGAKYCGRPLGTFGQLGCFSFHETKNLVSGEGGALAVNCAEFADAADIVHQKGTNRKQFLRGEVDKYSWVGVGSSYAPSEITAAFLYGQLQQQDAVQAARMRLWRTYHQALADLEQAGCLVRPHWPQHCVHNAHIYYLLTADLTERQALLEYLAQRGIGATFHYVPLHGSPMGQRLGYRRGQLPVTEEMSQRLVRLPLYYELTEAEVLRVAEAVREFFQG